MTTRHEHLGERAKSRRKQLNLRRIDVVKMLAEPDLNDPNDKIIKIHPHTLANWEKNGYGRAKFDEAIPKLAKILKTTVSFLKHGDCGELATSNRHREMIEQIILIATDLLKELK